MRLSLLARLAALLAAAAPCAAAAEGALELLAPGELESESLLPLVEVRGHAGPRSTRGHDVMIAIDLSDSTTAYSGYDLDGDGPGGRTSPELWEEIEARVRDPAILRPLAALDLEDSVLFAELAAAEALVGRVDPRSLRIGIVVFSDEARRVAPLGSRPELLRRTLASLRRDFWRELRGTNLAAAIRASLAELRPAPLAPEKNAKAHDPALPPAAGRDASILLLSDGEPTRPVHGQRARQLAVEAAQDAALADVRVYPFALGTEAVPALDVYRALAATSGGRFERIEHPAETIARLRRVDLADLAVLRIENLTAGQPARALRVFPDGTFDAFVALAPGRNRLRVTATAVDGSEMLLERGVTYRPEPAASAALEADRNALLAELRRRTREVELWSEIERGRRDPVRILELQAAP